MGYNHNCEIWHGASQGTLFKIQEEPIWRSMWGPCFCHKRAMFWPFLGKGATGYTQQCEILLGASLGTLIDIQCHGPLRPPGGEPHTTGVFTIDYNNSHQNHQPTPAGLWTRQAPGTFPRYGTLLPCLLVNSSSTGFPHQVAIVVHGTAGVGRYFWCGLY